MRLTDWKYQSPDQEESSSIVAVRVRDFRLLSPVPSVNHFRVYLTCPFYATPRRSVIANLSQRQSSGRGKYAPAGTNASIASHEPCDIDFFLTRQEKLTEGPSDTLEWQACMARTSTVVFCGLAGHWLPKPSSHGEDAGDDSQACVGK